MVKRLELHAAAIDLLETQELMIDLIQQAPYTVLKRFGNNVDNPGRCSAFAMRLSLRKFMTVSMAGILPDRQAVKMRRHVVRATCRTSSFLNAIFSL